MTDRATAGAASWAQGKSVVVTGAARGMGAAIATMFSQAGARVVLADIVADAGEETASKLRDDGGDAVFVRTDVAQGDDVAAAVAVAVDRFGGLDCAVNAAAIETERGPVHECEDEVFDRLIAVNLRSVFLSLKYEIRAMLATGRGGSIVNIASTNSFRPQANQPGYTASKHGVLGITRATAVDYGRLGIRVNAICPGAIDTPMLRGAMERRGGDPAEVAARLSLFARFGEVEEIAEAAMWLCSPHSSFTTGHARRRRRVPGALIPAFSSVTHDGRGTRAAASARRHPRPRQSARRTRRAGGGVIGEAAPDEGLEQPRAVDDVTDELAHVPIAARRLLSHASSGTSASFAANALDSRRSLSEISFVAAVSPGSAGADEQALAAAPNPPVGVEQLRLGEPGAQVAVAG